MQGSIKQICKTHILQDGAETLSNRILFYVGILKQLSALRIA